METENAIYFYGIKGKFGFLSNFYKCNFVRNDKIFNCSEQFFIYQKSKLFEPKNLDLQKKILEETSPTKIKRLGRKAANFNEKIWSQHKQKIMKAALLLKFGQSDVLKKKLLNTSNKTLYEASPYDKIWGIGMGAKKAIQTTEKTSEYGQNLLGLTLMEVREELNSLYNS